MGQEVGAVAYSWLIHIVVWQKSIQHCKAIILQLKISRKKKKRTQTCEKKAHSDQRTCLQQNAFNNHEKQETGRIFLRLIQNI